MEKLKSLLPILPMFADITCHMQELDRTGNPKRKQTGVIGDNKITASLFMISI
jgi:hypothetical protein